MDNKGVSKGFETSFMHPVSCRHLSQMTPKTPTSDHAFRSEDTSDWQPPTVFDSVKFIADHDDSDIESDAEDTTHFDNLHDSSASSSDAWWDTAQLLAQMKDVIRIFEAAHPNCQALFIFDQSSAHASLPEDALQAFDMNKSNGGKQRYQHDSHSSV
ncbi:hypothetical protein K503DRAFT_802528 [Rhizopogon vinicolor AM-OR11-026]|uniref:Uncharacterized protein n=1 Tax=Rhizopogon vinicolor AM-OR11-026 TaxID=1314800 RepID=A0A1B7MT67_9AGAM|nr:hypothetical protein K503DRAFT_802528 [Rhizopogon vinicolor AM-OR11-026]